MSKLNCTLAPALGVASLVLALTACERQSSAPSAPAPQSVMSTQIHHVRGVIREIKADGKTAVIKHEEVPGYMPAMTMPLEVKDPAELKGLKAGDVVSFRLLVTDDDGWIDEVKRVNAAPPTEMPSRETFRRVRSVDPLQVGDLLPEYQFTNELGVAVSTDELRGQVVAFTFLFTRCPFPLFCPRMAENFAAAQRRLKTDPGAPDNWRLMAITIDPEYDTPAVLREYARRYQADPERWGFLTGELIDITAIAEQFGQTFWRSGDGVEGLSHNLRTVVLDASGRVRAILPENKWTPEELVAEMIKASKADAGSE